MSHTYDHGGNVFDVARQLGIAPGDIADFSASINPLGLSAMVKKAIICSMESLVHYPDSSHRELKQELADYHVVSPANIVIANGSTELIYNLPAMLHGKRALIVSPSFSEYVRALGQQHWEAKHFILKHENNFALDLEALKHTLAEGYDALYLCNPANPGGTLYPLRIIEQVYSLCIESGTFLVLDEAFMDFCEEASAKRFMVKGDNGIVLRSMTKFFGIPGLRLGYAIASSTLVEHLDAMGGPWSVNTLALAAGVAALRDSEHNHQTLEYIRLERRKLFEKLSEFKQLKAFPSSVNYLLLQVVNGMSSWEIRDKLMLQRILVRDCASFMGLSSQFIRVAVRTAEENERLVSGLKGVLK
jgi:threonine-phosphate decarboxylase